MTFFLERARNAKREKDRKDKGQGQKHVFEFQCRSNQKGYTLKLKVMAKGQGVKGREKERVERVAKGSRQQGKEKINERCCAVGRDPHLPLLVDALFLFLVSYFMSTPEKRIAVGGNEEKKTKKRGLTKDAQPMFAMDIMLCSLFALAGYVEQLRLGRFFLRMPFSMLFFSPLSIIP